MKAARLVVLTVAVAAGGVAAMLAGRSEKPPEVKTAPVVRIATVDVLVAKSDIGMGQTVSPVDVQWQEWPANAATGNFIRKSDRPNAIETLSGSIARYPFVGGDRLAADEWIARDGPGQRFDGVRPIGLADKISSCRVGRPFLPLHVDRRNRLAHADIGFGDENIDRGDLDHRRGLDLRRFFRAASQHGGNTTRCDGDGQHNKTRGFHTLHSHRDMTAGSAV